VGRRPGGPRWGPRPIDLDILLFEDVVTNSEDLVLPHPRMAKRSFVLVPLAEIAPEVRDPLSGRAVRESLAAVGEEGVTLVAPVGWHPERPPSAGPEATSLEHGPSAT
jgi:7,8-dihydro-6-hydroxymethylpterin-pyrophosphokinase